jgi:hypothetical protein
MYDSPARQRIITSYAYTGESQLQHLTGYTVGYSSHLLAADESRRREGPAGIRVVKMTAAAARL